MTGKGKGKGKKRSGNRLFKKFNVTSIHFRTLRKEERGREGREERRGQREEKEKKESVSTLLQNRFS